MPSESYVAMASSSQGLGDPDIVSQHLLASSRVRKLSPTTATAERQLRAAHMWISHNPRKEVASAHAHATLQFYFEKVDGHWKISGMKGSGDFMEGDILSVFPAWPGKDKAKWALQ